jgi:hypothetical protein
MNKCLFHFVPMSKKKRAILNFRDYDQHMRFLT